MYLVSVVWLADKIFVLRRVEELDLLKWWTYTHSSLIILYWCVLGLKGLETASWPLLGEQSGGGAGSWSGDKGRILEGILGKILMKRVSVAHTHPPQCLGSYCSTLKVKCKAADQLQATLAERLISGLTYFLVSKQWLVPSHMVWKKDSELTAKSSAKILKAVIEVPYFYKQYSHLSLFTSNTLYRMLR